MLRILRSTSLILKIFIFIKGNKIKAEYQQGSGGKFETKIKTLPKEPTLKTVRDFLGVTTSRGGRQK